MANCTGSILEIWTFFIGWSGGGVEVKPVVVVVVGVGGVAGGQVLEHFSPIRRRPPPDTKISGHRSRPPSFLLVACGRIWKIPLLYEAIAKMIVSSSSSKIGL